MAQGSRSAWYLLLCIWELRMAFTFFRSCEKEKEYVRPCVCGMESLKCLLSGPLHKKFPLLWSNGP